MITLQFTGWVNRTATYALTFWADDAGTVPGRICGALDSLRDQVLASCPERQVPRKFTTGTPSLNGSSITITNFGGSSVAATATLGTCRNGYGRCSFAGSGSSIR